MAVWFAAWWTYSQIFVSVSHTFLYHCEYKEGRAVIMPKYSNPTTFFAQVLSLEFLASVWIVWFSISVFFHFAWVYKGNYLVVPMYNVVFGTSCSLPSGLGVSWWFTLKTHWWPLADKFHPCGGVVSLAYQSQLVIQWIPILLHTC